MWLCTFVSTHMQIITNSSLSEFVVHKLAHYYEIGYKAGARKQLQRNFYLAAVKLFLNFSSANFWLMSKQNMWCMTVKLFCANATLNNIKILVLGGGLLLSKMIDSCQWPSLMTHPIENIISHFGHDGRIAYHMNFQYLMLSQYSVI